MQKKIFLSLLFSSFSLFGIECFGGCDPEPECECPLFNTNCAIILDTEFLYWTTEINSVDYAIKNSHPNPNQLAGCAVGKYQIADYDLDPAFRLGLRYYHAHKYWEVSGQYTRFYNCGSNSASVNPSNEDLVSTFLILSPINNSLISADSSISLHYQLADFLVARVWDPNPHLRIRTQLGIAGAWISQSWNLDYLAQNMERDSISTKWSFEGGGFRLGSTVDWFWFCNTYLTGRFSFALLAGTYKNNIDLKSTTLDFPDFPFYDTEYKDTRLAYHVQFLLGPSMQWPGPCWSFELFAGYELNAWFNLHEIRRCEPISNGFNQELFSSGLLGIQGLTVRLTIGY